MKNKISMISASVLIFLIGLIVYVNASVVNSNDSFSVKPFVATFSYYKENGNPSTSQVLVQKVSALRKSKVTQYTNDNGKLKQLSGNETTLQQSALEYTPEHWSRFSSADILRSSPTFIREDEICGLKVYVLRFTNLGSETLEGWFAPETGPVALKTIIDRGEDGKLISEATKVEFIEVTDDEVK